MGGNGTPRKTSVAELTDEQLAEKRRTLLLGLRQENSIEELRQEIRDIEQVIRDKETRSGSVITLPTDGEGSKNLSPAEPASDCSDTGEVEVLQGSGTTRFPNPDASPATAPKPPAEPVSPGNAHYKR